MHIPSPNIHTHKTRSNKLIKKQSSMCVPQIAILLKLKRRNEAAAQMQPLDPQEPKTSPVDHHAAITVTGICSQHLLSHF